MKLASAVLIVCCAAVVPSSNAQDGTGQCGLNDSECLEAQVERQCRNRTEGTVQSCTVWIESIQTRARADDRVAMRYIAGAHVTISGRTADSGERLLHRNSARAIYAELVEQDPRDVESLFGMATLARDVDERIDLLRQIASIAPGSPEAALLAEALATRGGESDALEAAEILEARYRVLPKNDAGWALAARAVALYERAGAADRGRYFRDRVRDELGAASLVSELQRIPETTFVRAGQILDRLCDRSAVAVLGANVCLEGLSEMSSTVARIPDRVGAPGFAEVLARRVWIMATISGWERVTRDTNWQRTISSIFLAMEGANIESPMILVSRARLSELDPVQKLRLVNRAAQLAAPDDGSTLQILADEYLSLRRFTEALALLRMRRQLPTTTESQREYIDRNIGALERVEQASRESGAAR